jgi:hypothetical protein
MVIAAGTDDVDRALGRSHAQDLGAQGPRTAGQLAGRLAAHLQPHQEGAHLRRRGVAAGHDLEGALGLVYGQRLCIADLGQKRAEIVDVAAH